MYKWEISPCWITRGSWWFPRLQLDAHHCHRGRSRLRRRPLPWWKVARVSTFALDPEMTWICWWSEWKIKENQLLVESIGHICLFLRGVVKQIQDQQPIFWGMFMRIRNIVVHFLMITAAHTSSLAKEWRTSSNVYGGRRPPASSLTIGRGMTLSVSYASLFAESSDAKEAIRKAGTFDHSCNWPIRFLLGTMLWPMFI